MHADDVRLNPRVIAASGPAALRDELARLGFPGDVRDLSPQRAGSIAVAIEGLSAAEAWELRGRWAASGGEVLVAGDPGAATPLPALVAGSPEQFGRAAEACPGFAPAAVLAGAVRAWLGTPAPILGMAWGRRTRLMGILNVTPDSFSDGGRWADPGAAADHARRMVAAGADFVDVGGESTRPGAAEVDAEEEARRVVPVIRALAGSLGAPISIDTTKAAVARAALDAGAALVNDISGLAFDPAMAPLVAARGVPVVVMHIQGTPRTMQASPHYRDAVAEICASLRASIARAAAAGIPEDRVIVDPGIGFGKTPEHNLDILRRLRELRTLGRPVLLGASRKSFLGRLTGLPPDRRALPSTAAAAWAIGQGADILRVHDVEEHDAVRRVLDPVARGD